MSRPRRTSISIHDYPEDLNPFNDDSSNARQSTVSVELRHKEPKNKFWTFGKSRKKRSNSFSIKSTWNGIFGKKKDPEADRRTTITTVSTSYQNGHNAKPAPSPRVCKDTREFEEAFGTFTRRKKYSMESSSRYGSNLTVNGDPARLYNGAPQDTTASILGELTPKPPARRFGQVSPRPNRDIPPLEFDTRENTRPARDDSDDRVQEQVPVPTKRSGRRSLIKASVMEEQPEAQSSTEPTDLSITDENENVPDDFIFRRCGSDALRRSNISINSCVSTASGMSVLGRKKRRAPQPPQRRETTENVENKSASSPTRELPLAEAIEITKVTEDIQEMTKQSQNIDRTIGITIREESTEGSIGENANRLSENDGGKTVENGDEKATPKREDEETGKIGEEKDDKNTNGPTSDKVEECSREKTEVVVKSNASTEVGESSPKEAIEVDEVRIERIVEEKLEIITDIDEVSEESEDAQLRKQSAPLCRSESFSVKEQIEQIEKQIKELESKNKNNNNNNGTSNDSIYYEPSETRLSIQANRRSFFKNMVNGEANGVKIEIKELPREQREIEVIKLTDPPVPVKAPAEPVKVVELHISEPIKQVPEFVEDINVNPLPKPRRHNSNPPETDGISKSDIKANITKSRDARGDSL